VPRRARLRRGRRDKVGENGVGDAVGGIVGGADGEGHARGAARGADAELDRLDHARTGDGLQFGEDLAGHGDELLLPHRVLDLDHHAAAVERNGTGALGQARTDGGGPDGLGEVLGREARMRQPGFG